MLPIDFHVSLKTYAVQQYFDSVGGARLSLENSRETSERARLNQHLDAGLQIDADFHKTRVIDLGGDDFDHPVIDRRGIAAYTHDAMYASGETNFMKQTVYREPGEEISGKQRLNERRRFAREFIETVASRLGEKCFHAPCL